MKKATFTKMTDGTQDDYTPIVEAAMVHSENLPDRIIEHLNMLKDDCVKQWGKRAPLSDSRCHSKPFEMPP